MFVEELRRQGLAHLAWSGQLYGRSGWLEWLGPVECRHPAVVGVERLERVLERAGWLGWAWELHDRASCGAGANVERLVVHFEWRLLIVCS